MSSGPTRRPVGAELREVREQAWGEVLTAFWRYEKALVSNDVDVLDAAFLDGTQTIRSDADGTLVGSEAISGFRRSRQPPPPRQVHRLHLREVGDGVVLVVAETERGDGVRGTQTQWWRPGPDGWQIVAAHVGLSPARELGDGQRHPGAVWRVVDEVLPLRPGQYTRALSGVRVAVKDLFAVAGHQVGAGNPDWLAESPVREHDAVAVAALVSQGAELVGIAHTDELAFSLAGTNPHYGTPPNPAAPDCIPGGSTSGPASAVAAGSADLGLGTDTAGSIRVPASYCGLYGWRPTHGAVSVVGVTALAPSFDTVGLLARDPQVLRRGADALLAAATPGRPVSELVVADDVLDLVDETMRTAFVAGFRALAGRTGLPVRRTTAVYDGELESWFTAFRTVQAAEAWQQDGAFVERHPGSLDPATEARFRSGATVSADALELARGRLAAARTLLDLRLPPGVALALPATSSPAPRIGLDAAETQRLREATLRLTCLASLTGRPALVLPTLRIGLQPAGLCLVGFHGGDRALLDLLEPTTPGLPPRPEDMR